MPLSANAAFTDRHRLRTIEIANPGAGNTAPYTVAAGEVIQIVALRFQLATAIAVVDRRINIRVMDSVGAWPTWAAVSSIVQPASQTWSYRFVCGIAPVDATGDSGDVYAPLGCGVQMYDGERLDIVCDNMNALDVISGIYMRVYHWKED